ncbi:MAG: hypothetical protein J5584_03460 [Clostridia bacterium]|nr:hypothetical protein [Clostridia bacterium]
MLKLSEIVKILDAQVLTGEENMDLEIYSGCGADLMSDVMAFVKESVILCTGLVNPQVVRTAEMMDIKVLCFVRGKVPGDQVIELAKEKGITIIATQHPLFICCGMLYSNGIKGRGVWN